MHLEHGGNPEYPYKIIFHNHEIDLISAVFKEHIFNLASNGRSDLISDYDAALAGWEWDTETSAIFVELSTTSSILEKLEEFSANTGEAVEMLPEQTGVAAYANEHIPLRFALGKQAIALADSIREAQLSFGDTGLEDELAQIIKDQNQSQE